jgi:hypothetical protein
LRSCNARRSDGIIAIGIADNCRTPIEKHSADTSGSGALAGAKSGFRTELVLIAEVQMAYNCIT